VGIPTPHFPSSQKKSKAGFELSGLRWSRWWPRFFPAKSAMPRNKKRGVLAVVVLLSSLIIADFLEETAAELTTEEHIILTQKMALGKYLNCTDL